MNGVIRIEFQVVDGKLQLMVNGPMKNQAEKDLTIQVLAQAIPAVIGYVEPAIHTNGNSKSPLLVPKTH